MQAPPHVELLHYRVGLREKMLADLAANDVVATRTVFAVDELEPSEAVDLGDGTRAMMIKDPDGHLSVLCSIHGYGFE